MNSADIIRMARKAGLAEPYHPFNPWGASQEALERFAALVAATERDRMCEQFSIFKELAHEKAKSDEANRTKVLGKGR